MARNEAKTALSCAFCLWVRAFVCVFACLSSSVLCVCVSLSCASVPLSVSLLVCLVPLSVSLLVCLVLCVCVSVCLCLVSFIALEGIQVKPGSTLEHALCSQASPRFGGDQPPRLLAG